MPILHWLTRENDLKISGLAPYRLLEHVETYGDSDTENMLIQSDNLDGLKALLPYYAGKVKCIYIDPPYNTWSAFEHYDDNLEHTVWLSMMYPRLEILRELLSEEGSIWASIDDNESHYLKVIMDEIFGRKNFITNIIWQKLYTVKNSAKNISGMHDHIICYSKNLDNLRFSLIEKTKKAIASYKNPDNDLRGPWTTNAVQARNYYSLGEYEITSPTGKKHRPPNGTYWRISQSTFESLNSDGRIWWGNTGDSVPRIKKFLSEVKSGVIPSSLWLYQEVGTNADAKAEIRALVGEEKIFGTPKPEALIQRVLHIATSPGDLVLDSFLGSGTTAAVAHKMGRRYVGIEIGEHAVTHCIPRLQKVIEGEQGGISKNLEWLGGGGFRFYRLGEAIFDDNGQVNKDIRFPQLAAHVWFSETKTPWNKMPQGEQIPLLGIHSGTAYYLLFNGILKDKSVAGGNVLTSKILESLPEHNGPKVIYGERCLFSHARLKQLDITFKHTPYDIKGR